MTTVIIERDDGGELARIPNVQVVPRAGDLLQSTSGLYVVTAVIWDLTDSPLASVRLICEEQS